MNMTADYYSGAKRIQFDGAPMRVAAWVGELGNDTEYREAIRPRDTYKAAYYASGFRVVKQGIPCRVAAYVEHWAPWMKAAILKPEAKSREIAETKAQAIKLGLNK